MKKLEIRNLIGQWKKSTKCGWWQGHLGTWPDIEEFTICLWSIDKSDFNVEFARQFSQKICNWALMLEMLNCIK